MAKMFGPAGIGLKAVFGWACDDPGYNFRQILHENDGPARGNCEYHLYLGLTLKKYEETLFNAHQRSCHHDGILREAG